MNRSKRMLLAGVFLLSALAIMAMGCAPRPRPFALWSEPVSQAKDDKGRCHDIVLGFEDGGAVKWDSKPTLCAEQIAALRKAYEEKKAPEDKYEAIKKAYKAKEAASEPAK